MRRQIFVHALVFLSLQAWVIGCSNRISLVNWNALITVPNEHKAPG